MIYKVYIDWSGSGFAGANDDISSDVMSANFSRGFDRELARGTGGTLDLELVDSTGKYSAENTSSVFYGTSLLGKKIKLVAGDSGEYPLFYGFVSKVQCHPMEKRAYIYAADGSDRLARTLVSTEMYTDTLTNSLVSIILALAGVSFVSESFDSGIDPVPYWYAENISALEAIGQLEDLEMSRFWIDGSGSAHWDNRHHSLLSPHDTPQSAISDSMQEITSTLDVTNVINIAEISAIPRSESVVSDTVFTLNEVVSIPPGDEYSFTAVLNTPTNNSVSYLAGDILANSSPDGLGSDLTSDLDIDIAGTGKARRWAVTLTNNSSIVMYITSFLLRGYPVTDGEAVVMSDEDATSQSDLGDLAFSQSADFQPTLAQEKAEYLIDRHKDPVTYHRVTLKSRNEAMAIIICSRDIGDRITITNTVLGTDGEFLIRKVEHSIKDKLHEVTWDMEPADTTVYWILDDEVKSVLGTTTRLAY